MAGGGKHKLQYVEQSTPKFLKDFKARANFKEGPTIDTKRQKLERKIDDSDDERDDREDEKPVICVLREGDLTEEEFKRLQGNQQDETESTESAGKVMFKKPTKKSDEEKHEVNASSNKKTKTSKEKQKKQSKKLDNKKLLSFDEEDE
ncbi:uncharacterized protein KIAA1143 homolog [Rhopilema esculentum]|uniref:uncharacterized protein KIAA1143 homolog n=1 Tax=Rhopilema esculentum TaxID=499914 RepID=UPI0031D36B11|eukprot:gene1487-15921_t